MSGGKDKDYYRVLGVSESASRTQIRRCYHRLAKKHHPDIAPEQDKEEATELLKEINEAYEVLSDPASRGAYDMDRLSRGAEKPPPRREAKPGFSRAASAFSHDCYDASALYRLFDMLAFAVLLVSAIVGLPILLVAVLDPARLRGVAELLVLPLNLGLWIFIIRAYLREDFHWSDRNEFLYPFTIAALCGLWVGWSECRNLSDPGTIFTYYTVPALRGYSYSCRHILRVELAAFAVSWAALAFFHSLKLYLSDQPWHRIRALAACLILSFAAWEGAKTLKHRRFLSLVEKAHNTVVLDALCNNARLGDHKAYMLMAAKDYAPPRCLERILDFCVPLSGLSHGSDDAYFCHKAVLSAAANANTPQYYLEKLSDEEAWAPYQWGEKQELLKTALAGNLSAPYSVLLKLSADQTPKIRRAVIENPAVPLDILKRLSRDPFEGNGDAAKKLLETSL